MKAIIKSFGPGSCGSLKMGHEVGDKFRAYDIKKDDRFTTFRICLKNGDELYCLKECCAHLDGGEWELIE